MMDLETIGGAAGASALVLGAYKVAKAGIAKARRKRTPKAENPATVASEAGASCWAYLRLDGPFTGFGSTIEPTSKPALLIEGLSLLHAAVELEGRALDWSRLPMRFREPLEMTGFLKTDWDEIKEWVK